MAGMLLTRLDARDRALFARYSVRERSSRPARLVWTALTHLGGVSCSVAVAIVPITVSGPVGLAARRAFVTLVVSHLIVQLVKRAVGRPRCRSRSCTRWHFRPSPSC
jgi:hypothetical protein